MASRFVDHFVVEPLDPDWLVPALVYDERRALNLDDQGRVAVEVDGAFGSTETFTKVSSENGDADVTGLGGLAGTQTVTEVRAEQSDTDADAGSYLYTETRVPNESEDFRTEWDASLCRTIWAR